MSLHMQIKYERQFAVQHPTYHQTLSCCPVAVPKTAGKFNPIIKNIILYNYRIIKTVWIFSRDPNSVWISGNMETHWTTSVVTGIFSLKALPKFHIKIETFDQSGMCAYIFQDIENFIRNSCTSTCLRHVCCCPKRLKIPGLPELNCVNTVKFWQAQLPVFCHKLETLFFTVCYMIVTETFWRLF